MKKIILIIAGIFAVSQFSFAEMCLPNVTVNGVVHTPSGNVDTINAPLINGDSLRVDVGVTALQGCQFCTQVILTVVNYTSGFHYNSTCYCGFITAAGYQTITLNTSDCISGTRVFVINVSYTTSILTIEKKSQFKVFPNPATTLLTVTTTSPEQSQIILYDIASRELMEEKFTGTAILNIENLAKGIYLYQVKDEKGVLTQGKVVKE